MEEQAQLRIVEEIRLMFPDSGIPPPDVFNGARRRRTDNETQGTSRKKARRSNGQGSDTEMQSVRAL